MLVDTSGLFCLHHVAEPLHTDAGTYFGAASRRLTHGYVLAEFVPLCQARGLNRAAALSFAVDLLDSPLVEVVWIDSAMHRSALAYLQARLDKTYSLCDAVSFLLMEQQGIQEALTTDYHFEQAGFRRLLK